MEASIHAQLDETIRRRRFVNREPLDIGIGEAIAMPPGTLGKL